LQSQFLLKLSTLVVVAELRDVPNTIH